MSKEKKPGNNRKTKVKGGPVSLVIGLALLFSGVAVAASPFISHPLAQQIASLATYWAGITTGPLAPVGPGVLLVVISGIVFSSRGKRPFNYIFAPFAVVIWYTVLIAVHMAAGNPEPEVLMSLVSTTRGSLVFVLAVLEALVAIVVAIINSSLNKVWLRHAEKRVVARERRAAEKKAEKERQAQEKKAAGKEKAGKAKEDRKAAKAGRKAPGTDGKAPEPAAPEPEEEPEDHETLVFPKTGRVPSFRTIPHEVDHVVGASAPEKPAEPVEPSTAPAEPAGGDFSIPKENVVSMSVLENSRRNIERKLEEERRANAPEPKKSGLFRKGGMLESAIEATREPKTAEPAPQGPIIGYDGRRHDKEKKTSSFAPSTLSPDHPRYKIFESLQRPSASGNGVSHFPGRAFTPDEPKPEREEAKAEPELSISLKDEPSPVHAAEPEPVHAPAPKPEPAREPEPEPVHEPQPKPEPRRGRQADAGKVITPAGDEEDILDRDEDEPVHEDNQIEFRVGVSGLASNNAGESAILSRQRRSYNPPSPDLLADFPDTNYEITEVEESTGRLIEAVMSEFHVEAELSGIVKGPTVTLYEYSLGPGVSVNKVEGLNRNIGMRLGGRSVRILAPVPGKSAVGVEVPNAKRVTVGFKELLKPLKAASGEVPVILGRDVVGQPKIIDIARQPHMLIAGTTGSGKSVCINCLVASILYTKSPKEVRLMMIDPKVVELSVYNGIPHLLTPVITEPKKVVKGLNWLVEEMDRRYRVFGQVGVRNIANFNSKIREMGIATEKMPYIILIMDEFADLMSVIGKEIDTSVNRITAKARAAGIHLVLATQRPSADVVTGTIKNNLPTRIAFAVSSGTNSRIILDENGAESLLGRGDMLISSQAQMGLARAQGAFLSEEEVDRIVSHAKTQGEPDYLDESIFEDEPEPEPMEFEGGEEGSDEDVYEAAKQIVFERKGASASYLQRRLSIGYNRAARLVERMEEEGIVGPANGSKPREVLRYE